MITLSKNVSLLALATVLSGTAAMACSQSENDAVEAKVELLGQKGAALTGGTITSIDGVYGQDCTERSGAWSVRVAGNGALNHDALSVIRGDSSCTLAITALVTDRTFLATPQLPVGSNFANAASAFAVDGDPIAFYANAKTNDASFGNDFTIHLTFSADPSGASAGGNATYATAGAAVSATSVDAPDYTADLDTDQLAFQVTLNQGVVAVSGKVDLVDGDKTGEAYVIDETLGESPSFDQLDAAFQAGTPVAIEGANPQIPASALDLVGANLSMPVLRTVIVAHTVAGVVSYEAITLTFAGTVQS